jgi:hypothetical protein
MSLPRCPVCNLHLGFCQHSPGEAKHQTENEGGTGKLKLHQGQGVPMKVVNFKDQPVSVNEVRADRANDAALWTPREALLKVLRDIDAGVIHPKALIICMASVEGDEISVEMESSCPDALTGRGLLDACKEQF